MGDGEGKEDERKKKKLCSVSLKGEEASVQRRGDVKRPTTCQADIESFLHRDEEVDNCILAFAEEWTAEPRLHVKTGPTRCYALVQD